MATYAYFEPFFAGAQQGLSGQLVPLTPIQGAAFRRGNFLIYSTTGTIVSPSGGAGALTGIAGPMASAITFGTAASAGAPAQTYYFQFTYQGSSNAIESATSQEYVVNVPAGYVPTATVSSTGAPTGATSYGAYVSLYPQYEVLQRSAASPVALGTAQTMTYPLAISGGVNICPTNQAASIIGFATVDSNAVFYTGTGGSQAVGNQSLFGSTNSQSPLEPNEAFQIYALKCQNAVFEISFRQAWSPTLVGTTAGLTLDPTTGVHIADNSQANKILNIVGAADGVPTIQGVAGDIGKRILVSFNGGLV